MLVVAVRQGTLGEMVALRSGREHWAWLVVFEVRQGTLGMDGRGWGPAENNVDRGSQLDEDNEDDKEDEDDEEDEDEEDEEAEGGGRQLT